MHQPFKILMVEDNPGDVRLTQIAFARSDAPTELDVVNDGDQALDYLRRHGAYSGKPRPHLVLLDLNMPGKSGFAVLGEIKQDPELRTIPVCVLTSSCAESDIAGAYRLQANCYVTKPQDFTRFQEVVLEIVGFWATVARTPQVD